MIQRLLRYGSLCLMLTGCSQSVQEVPYYNTPDFTPLWKSEKSFLLDTLHHIEPFSFTNQKGESITEKTFAGKIYVANFFFTVCPSICPRMTANLKLVAEAFKNHPEVMILSHSVTPEMDSVEVLRRYGEEHGIDPQQWHLVTGNVEEIYSLARHSYFVEEEIGFTRDNKEFLHTEHFILVDTQGHIRGVYNGTLELEARRMIDDIQVLLATKTAN